ncbi:unnamed protein product [Mytilus coruscus]|uniref:C1q domain-containing protein n=1 Tax=Mytilus coruscus TaxID=42192 RepID=A0A6J8DIQ8_MYTCO|nr:unnamed protein product [Mytilus coruscus]
MVVVKVVGAISIKNNSFDEDSILYRLKRMEAQLLANPQTNLLSSFLQLLTAGLQPKCRFQCSFELVKTNEGGHYNNFDGVFVAPQDGVYLFSWTVTSAGTSYIMTELVVDNNIISSTGGKNTAFGTISMSASMTDFCRMKKDEHAWIRTTGRGGSHYLHNHNNYPRSSFLCLLVYQE